MISFYTSVSLQMLLPLSVSRLSFLSFSCSFRFRAAEQINVEIYQWDVALWHLFGSAHYLCFPMHLCKWACVCVCVCIQRFVSQDFLPPELQHQVLSGARLRHALMVKLLLQRLTSWLTTNHNGVEWTCSNWTGVSATVPLAIDHKQSKLTSCHLSKAT